MGLSAVPCPLPASYPYRELGNLKLRHCALHLASPESHRSQPKLGGPSGWSVSGVDSASAIVRSVSMLRADAASAAEQWTASHAACRGEPGKCAQQAAARTLTCRMTGHFQSRCGTKRRAYSCAPLPRCMPDPPLQAVATAGNDSHRCPRTKHKPPPYCAVVMGAQARTHVRSQVISFLSADGIVQFPISQSGRRVRASLQHFVLCYTDDSTWLTASTPCCMVAMTVDASAADKAALLQALLQRRSQRPVAAPLPTWEEQGLCIGATFFVRACRGTRMPSQGAHRRIWGDHALGPAHRPVHPLYHPSSGIVKQIPCLMSLPIQRVDCVLRRLQRRTVMTPRDASTCWATAGAWTCCLRCGASLLPALCMCPEQRISIARMHQTGIRCMPSHVKACLSICLCMPSPTFECGPRPCASVLCPLQSYFQLKHPGERAAAQHPRLHLAPAPTNPLLSFVVCSRQNLTTRLFDPYLLRSQTFFVEIKSPVNAYYSLLFEKVCALPRWWRTRCSAAAAR